MPRVNEALVPVRMTPELRASIAAFGERAGLLNDQGQPNMSASCVLLLAMGLDSDGAGGETARAAVEVARSAVLRDVLATAKEAFSAVVARLDEMG